MIIGLTGPMGSGKTTVVNVLLKLGYKLITLSDMVREECQRLGIKEERENLMNVGQSLRRKHGTGVLASRALEKIRNRGGGKWIIDGIRNPMEVEVLRSEPGFILLANTVPENMIIERIMSRKRSDDTFDETSIRRKLRREWGEGEPPDGQQVGKCVEMADYVFENIMPFEKVEEAFTKFYNRIVAEKSK